MLLKPLQGIDKSIKWRHIISQNDAGTNTPFKFMISVNIMMKFYLTTGQQVEVFYKYIT